MLTLYSGRWETKNTDKKIKEKKKRRQHVTFLNKHIKQKINQKKRGKKEKIC